MDLIWITKADYVSDFKINLTFNNGMSGIVELRKKIERLPIYEPLKDKDYFKNFRLNSWTIEWENGADFAPESLYELAKQGNKTTASKVQKAV